MSEQRLSKLQKWILENCFRVTVLLDRSTLKALHHLSDSRKCKGCPKTAESVRLSRDHHNALQHLCGNDGKGDCPYFEFYREDILLSFFSLPPDNDKAHFSRVQHFHDSPDYAKAHVTLHRSVNSLIEKGLAYTWNTFKEDSQQICLTDNGMKKAAEFLKQAIIHL
jgi:hypothetical protein